jgi:RNA polymerase sigma-70 factor (ECF subfamily)
MDYNQIIPFIPNLRRYARALVGDRDGADDLVQDTLERAVRKFHLWRPGDLRAWLFSIMHNVFVNQVKLKKLPYDAESVEDLPIAAHEGGRDEMLDLQRALLRLSPQHREVLLLVALEDMTYQEVAGSLGIPVGTVMSRLSRGRERLRELMEGKPQATPLRVVQ